MSNKKRAKKTSAHLKNKKPQNLKLVEYEITTEPIHDRHYRRLPNHIKDKVANFMGFIGIYFLKTGKKALAEQYYKMLAEIACDYPMTQKLRKQLYPGFFRRIFRKMIGNY